ncbi:MAG: hypothetical protein ACP6IQ_01945 [Candidatus Njordarchaeia archaeon]
MLKVKEGYVEKVFRNYDLVEIDEDGNETLIGNLFQEEKEITNSGTFDEYSIEEAIEKFPWLKCEIERLTGEEKNG